MKLKRYHAIEILVFALACTVAYPLHAQNSAASFLNIDPSPRSYALGSADSIASAGAQALGRNPANMGFMDQKYEAFASYETILDAATYGDLAFSMFQPGFLPEAIEAIGFSYTRLGVSNIQGADSSGNLTGSSFTSQNTAVTFGASSHLSTNLRAGLDLKGVESSISSYSSNWAFATDLGLTMTLPEAYISRLPSFLRERPTNVTFSVDNLGQSQKFLSQSDHLPTSINIGAGIPILSHATTFLQLQNLVYDHVTSFSVGFEYTLGPVDFRLGYINQFNAPSNLASDDQSLGGKFLDGFSSGIGLRWQGLRIDYAVSQQAVDYGATQRIALTYAFGEQEDINKITPDQPHSPSNKDWRLQWTK